MKIIVTGNVVVSDITYNVDLSGLRIEVWDGDRYNDADGSTSADDQLGSQQLNPNGSFEISDDTEKWRDIEPLVKNRPDVFFRIFNGANEIEHAPTGKWRKTSNAEVYEANLRISAKGINAQDDSTKEALNRINRAFDTFVAYAPTANEDEATDSGSRVSDLERLVSDAQRDILGKRIRYDDVKSVESALDRVFVFEHQQGNRVVRWKRPTFTVETELGGDLTGAQASLFDIVQSTAESIKQRIEALQPLNEKRRDQDRMDAARINFLTELEDLIGALSNGIVPRKIRVEDCLTRLDNYLAEIEYEFGFGKSGNVDNVNDERLKTEFKMIKTRLGTIRYAWEEYGLNPEFTFGETLRRLEGLLGVVASGVGEVYKAMNRVAFNQRERAATSIQLNDDSEMTVAELFDWVLTLASVKAPRQLKDGGARAWPRIRTEAGKLCAEIEMLAENNDEAVPAFLHPGVNRTIQELVGYLRDVVDALPEENPIAANKQVAAH